MQLSKLPARPRIRENYRNRNPCQNKCQTVHLEFILLLTVVGLVHVRVCVCVCVRASCVTWTGKSKVIISLRGELPYALFGNGVPAASRWVADSLAVYQQRCHSERRSRQLNFEGFGSVRVPSEWGVVPPSRAEVSMGASFEPSRVNVSQVLLCFGVG